MFTYEEKEKKRDNDEVQAIIFTILNILQDLDHKGITHRDIKPENIMFKQAFNEFKNKNFMDFCFENLRIIDFGISCDKDSNQKINQYCGTPGFMAPEMYIDRSKEEFQELLNNKVDVFSLGAMFYFLQFGEFPFGVRNIDNIVERNRSNSFEKLGVEDQILLDRDEMAHDLLKKMMETEQKNRYDVKQCLEHPYFEKLNIKGRSKKRSFMDEFFDQSPSDIVNLKKNFTKRKCELSKFLKKKE